MSNTINLSAQIRTIIGRKTKSLRRQNLLPAHVYGKGFDSLALTLDYRQFIKTYELAGETNIIDLQVTTDSKTLPVLISNLDFDPKTDSIIHVDFRHVDLTQKIIANIPIRIIGEAPAVKETGATIITNLDEIEVKALPTQLPDRFDIDISTLNQVGDTITIAQITPPQDVEITLDPETVIISTQEQREEETPPEPTTAEPTPEPATTDSDPVKPNQP